MMQMASLKPYQTVNEFSFAMSGLNMISIRNASRPMTLVWYGMVVT